MVRASALAGVFWGVVVLFGVAPAQADPLTAEIVSASLPRADTSDAPDAISRWYGLPIAIIDVASLTQMTIAAVWAAVRPGEAFPDGVVGLAAIGFVGYLVGGPIVHRYAYRHRGMAFLSGVLRVVLPFCGVGIVAQAGGQLVSAEALGGLAAGALFASAIDVFALARDRVSPAVAARSRAPSWTFGW